MRVGVIGGGPAGMMAAYIASKNGAETYILESNDKLGKKLYITGKGRCNVSNMSIGEEFLNNIVNNKKFLYSSLNNFNCYDTISFFADNGVVLKEERGARLFPESDKASDIINALKRACLDNNVNICLNEKVIKIEKNNLFEVVTKKNKYQFDKLIIATGGKTYTSTGSTGDGFSFAKKMGHSVNDLRPGLVPIKLKDEWVKDLQGLSLKNVKLIVNYNKKKYKELFGEMIFTHFGISGPIVLSMSSFINKLDISKTDIYIDFKPALSEEKLENRITREFNENKNKHLIKVLNNLLPKKLAKVFLEHSRIENKIIKCINLKEKNIIVNKLKAFNLQYNGLLNLDYGIITSGGVDVKNINPKTMESKLNKDLYFAGEVIDVDALTGGYNIQIALSTGYTAGMNAIKE